MIVYDVKSNPLGWYTDPRDGHPFPATNNPLFDRLRMFGYVTTDGGRTWTLRGNTDKDNQ